jgi:hypothetical protein
MSHALFRTTAAGLLQLGDGVEGQIVRGFEEVMRRAPGESERRSWRNSLPLLASLLADAHVAAWRFSSSIDSRCRRNGPMQF